jgi:hypothetical protein
MARQETVISVFVASPSDVEEERNRLEEVIREFNITWARDLGLRIELIRWETHAYPSFGLDPQTVINKQIPQDYDLFIGIMWYRFGTPTTHASSGTLEEFQLAKDRFDHDKSLQLMVYFKDAPAPVAPSKLDYSQLSNVSKFRESLGKEGGLYWSFNTTEDFVNLVRLHLTRYVQEWRSRTAASTQTQLVTTEKNPTICSESQESDLGLLDLMEQVEIDFETLSEITERITSATFEIGQKMEARTLETQKFITGKDAKSPKAAKRLIEKAAVDMDQFVSRMEAEVPLFSRHLNSGFKAITKTAAIAIESKITEEDLEQINNNILGIHSFVEIIHTVKEQVIGFQQSVAALPRMTAVLNRSKRAMVTIIQKMIDEFHSAEVLANEAETSFASIIQQQGNLNT